jgi:hypothetical protein
MNNNVLGAAFGDNGIAQGGWTLSTLNVLCDEFHHPPSRSKAVRQALQTLLFGTDEPTDIDTGFIGMTEAQIDARGQHIIIPVLNGIKLLHKEALARSRGGLPYIDPRIIADTTGQIRGQAIRNAFSQPIPPGLTLVRATEADITRRAKHAVPAECKLSDAEDKASWSRAIHQWLGMIGLEPVPFLHASKNPNESRLDIRNSTWMTNVLTVITKGSSLAVLIRQEDAACVNMHRLLDTIDSPALINARHAKMRSDLANVKASTTGDVLDAIAKLSTLLDLAKFDNLIISEKEKASLLTNALPQNDQRLIPFYILLSQNDTMTFAQMAEHFTTLGSRYGVSKSSTPRGARIAQVSGGSGKAGQGRKPSHDLQVGVSRAGLLSYDVAGYSQLSAEQRTDLHSKRAALSDSLAQLCEEYPPSQQALTPGGGKFTSSQGGRRTKKSKTNHYGPTPTADAGEGA